MRPEPTLPGSALDAGAPSLHRSPLWPRAERLHLSTNPFCACCREGTNPAAAVQVHHIIPFHECVALGRPDLELDPRNLITLCEAQAGRPAENHHLLVGHLGSFQSSNPEVVEAARVTFHGLTAPQIRASDAWQRAVAQRSKPLAAMSPSERAAFAQQMNARFPRRV